MNLVDKLFEAKKEKKWDQATILILHAKTELILYLKNPDIITELEEMVDYMRKYTPGANYAYVVNEGIDVLKKDKTNTGISEAVECLVLLLSQNYFLKGKQLYIKKNIFIKKLLIVNCTVLSNCGDFLGPRVLLYEGCIVNK